MQLYRCFLLADRLQLIKTTMTGLLILILIFIGLPYIWRWLKPYFYRWMQRRTEDYVRRAMGMPPHDKSRREQHRSYGSSTPYGNEARRQKHTSGPLIPKEYAVDVEYTEIRSYSSEEVIASDGKDVRYVVESQVTDAEIIEIRKDR